MNSNEAKIQLNSLIEHFKHGGLDFNATDISAIEILLDENKKYKEIINKAKKWVKNRINHCTIEANSTTTDTMCRIAIVGLNNLLDILKEVEHE